MTTHRIRAAVLLLGAAIALAGTAHAAGRQDRSGNDQNNRVPASRGYVLDHRYNHDRYYPPRGYA
ncbi:MAG: hypothetical protein ACRET4_12425, partial [Steroidobacteraceae bacterium]